MGAFVAVVLRSLVVALWLLMLGRVFISWIDPRYSGTAGRLLYQTTEPILGPIRRVLPSTGGLDFSPFVAIIVLSILVRMVGLV